MPDICFLVSRSGVTWQLQLGPAVTSCGSAGAWPHSSRLKLLRVLSTVQISGILGLAVTLLQCYTRPAGGMPGMLGTTHNTAVTARNETGSSSYV